MTAQPPAARLSTPTVSRRSLLAGAAGSGLVLAAGAGSAAALQAPPARVRHFLNRFTGGYTPADARSVAQHGGPEGWLEWQLRPDRIKDAPGDDIRTWYPSIRRAPAEHYRRSRNSDGYAFDTSADHGRLAMMLRARSTRQLRETMVDFWANHLYVQSLGNKAWLWRKGFDDTIRRHALGRFDEMLVATLPQATMLAYLDADLSVVVRRTRPSGAVETTERLNENLGRELLELHTVGAESGYTEAMVRDSARILTGWRIDRTDSWTRYYDPASHYTGPVSVLGFSDPNGNRDGQDLCERYLTYLARHPDTARRIATKIVTRFVADDPPAQLVDDLAAVYLANDTSTAAVLRALVAHPQFYSEAKPKVRTPIEDVVATMRALGVRPRAPGGSTTSFGNAVTFLANSVGQSPYMWPTPDGYPDQGAAWASSGRVMGSWRMHYMLASGYWPDDRVRYRVDAQWLPRRSIRFRELVDHLSVRLLGVNADAALLGAASLAVDTTGGEVITRDHPVAKWRMGKLIGLILDSHEHMHR